MRIIGLTGGIASGKSTVSGQLREEFGAEILDADAVAYALSEPEQPMWNAFVSRYGKTRALRSDGNLDREAIAGIVFRDEAERNWMDGTMHPMIRTEMLSQLSACKAAGKSVVVLDVPLLYEVGWESLAGEVWVVYIDKETQLRRLMARNGITEDMARDRIASQMSMEDKKCRADVVIDNRGTLDETRLQVRKAFAGQ